MTNEEKARELTIKNVTDGKSKYFSWGFYKGCVVGLEYNNKQIAELEEKISVLLSCKNCSENKGGLICAKEYENKCLAQKIEFIQELKKENAELKAQIKKRCAKDLIKVQKENEAFVANLKESVEIQEKTVESLTDKIARLLQLVEQLKKSAIVWHKIIYQDDPDNTDRCLVANSPAEEDKEYLLKTKYGFAVDKLDYDETGFFFQDYDWDSIEAWAELPEVGK